MELIYGSPKISQSKDNFPHIPLPDVYNSPQTNTLIYKRPLYHVYLHDIIHTS